MIIFGYIWLKYGKKVAPKSINSMVGALQDVIHKKNEGGAGQRPQRPKSQPQGPNPSLEA